MQIHLPAPHVLSYTASHYALYPSRYTDYPSHHSHRRCIAAHISTTSPHTDPKRSTHTGACLGTNAVVPAGLSSEPRGPPTKIIQLVPLLPQCAYAKAIMLLTKETGRCACVGCGLVTFRDGCARICWLATMMKKWSICGYVEMETKVCERMGKIVEGLS